VAPSFGRHRDPLGPALFTLTIHGITSVVKSDLNVWYLDHGCISGDPQTVLNEAAIIGNGLSSVGLEINNSKCELLIVNNTTSQERSQTTKLFQDVFPSISIPAPDLWQLLGSSLHQDSTPLYLEAKTKMLDNIIENLELIEPHQEFFILKNCLSIPKLIYLLRRAPCFKCKEKLEVFDTAIKTNMEKICNVSFGNENWSQASLPIRHAGLGLCSAADLSLPCFLSSSHACKDLVNRLLPSLNLQIPYGDVNDAIDDWPKHHDSSPREKGIEVVWDDLACRDTLNSLININNPWNHCQLLAAQESHTAAWSEAFPIASIGNLLSPDELRIAIALRTGAKIFESTKCCCGKIVDELGLHGLPCTRNAGCFPRQSIINFILKRSLTRIGLPSTLELVGLTNDGRRSNGLTLGPWYRGLSLVWDARVVDTFSQGHYKDSARQAGSAATKAEVTKCQRYHDLQSNYHFQPVAIETTGVYGKSTTPF